MNKKLEFSPQITPNNLFPSTPGGSTTNDSNGEPEKKNFKILKLLAFFTGLNFLTAWLSTSCVSMGCLLGIGARVPFVPIDFVIDGLGFGGFYGFAIFGSTSPLLLIYLNLILVLGLFYAALIFGIVDFFRKKVSFIASPVKNILFSALVVIVVSNILFLGLYLFNNQPHSMIAYCNHGAGEYQSRTYTACAADTVNALARKYDYTECKITPSVFPFREVNLNDSGLACVSNNLIKNRELAPYCEGNTIYACSGIAKVISSLRDNGFDITSSMNCDLVSDKNTCNYNLAREFQDAKYCENITNNVIALQCNLEVGGGELNQDNCRLILGDFGYTKGTRKEECILLWAEKEGYTFLTPEMSDFVFDGIPADNIHFYDDQLLIGFSYERSPKRTDSRGDWVREYVDVYETKLTPRLVDILDELRNADYVSGDEIPNLGIGKSIIYADHVTIQTKPIDGVDVTFIKNEPERGRDKYFIYFIKNNLLFKMSILVDIHYEYKMPYTDEMLEEIAQELIKSENPLEFEN